MLELAAQQFNLVQESRFPENGVAFFLERSVGGTFLRTTAECTVHPSQLQHADYEILARPIPPESAEARSYAD